MDTDTESWLKGFGAAGGIITLLFGFIGNRSMKKQDDHDIRLGDLEENTVRKQDLKDMETRIMAAINTQAGSLNQRITDLINR